LAWKEKIPKIFAEIYEAQLEWENQKFAENNLIFNFEKYGIKRICKKS
jgi:hypothetical protein